MLAQIFWLILLAVASEFALRRMAARSSRRLLHPRFAWVGLGLLMGASGALLAAAGARLDLLWLHEVGRGLLLQGLFTGLVLGTADLLLPAIAGGSPPLPSRGRALAFALHAFGGAIFVASFSIGELVSARLGFALRAATPPRLAPLVRRVSVGRTHRRRL